MGSDTPLLFSFVMLVMDDDGSMDGVATDGGKDATDPSSKRAERLNSLSYSTLALLSFTPSLCAFLLH